MHHSAPEIAENPGRRVSVAARFKGDSTWQAFHASILIWLVPTVQDSN
jgi:hypothetical protein